MEEVAEHRDSLPSLDRRPAMRTLAFAPGASWRHGLPRESAPDFDLGREGTNPPAGCEPLGIPRYEGAGRGVVHPGLAGRDHEDRERRRRLVRSSRNDGVLTGNARPSEVVACRLVPLPKYGSPPTGVGGRRQANC